jgi:DNA invertase Pin-like site-specific DNA recombinase
MRTAYGYIRVSSEDQADSGLGLEAQRQRIRAYCDLKGLHLAEILEDPGISGGKALSGRPAGIKLLSIARKSKPVIVVAKFDRLFRSVADAAQTIVDFDRMGIELVAIAEGFDMTNPYAGNGTDGQRVRRVGTSHDPRTHAGGHEGETWPTGAD